MSIIKRRLVRHPYQFSWENTDERVKNGGGDDRGGWGGGGGGGKQDGGYSYSWYPALYPVT